MTELGVISYECDCSNGIIEEIETSSFCMKYLSPALPAITLDISVVSFKNLRRRDPLGSDSDSSPDSDSDDRFRFGIA